MAEILASLQDLFGEIPKHVIYAGHVFKIGALVRQMVMDERPASVLAACVVTYVGSFGGVTIANVLLGLPLLMFEDPYIVFLTMAITWLIDYAPNKVRDLLSSRPVTVAVTALHSLMLSSTLASMAEAGLKFPSLAAPIILACIGTFGALVFASLLYGESGSILNSPHPGVYKVIVNAMLYVAMRKYMGVGAGHAKTLVQIIFILGNTINEIVPFTAYEVWLGKAFHAITNTEPPHWMATGGKDKRE